MTLMRIVVDTRGSQPKCHFHGLDFFRRPPVDGASAASTRPSPFFSFLSIFHFSVRPPLGLDNRKPPPDTMLHNLFHFFFYFSTSEFMVFNTFNS